MLEELGVEILLNNTYHLYLRPGVEMVRQLGGVQRFMAWDKPILTDSGGFQVFSLSELRKVTEDGVAFRSHLDGSSHLFSPESAIAAEIGLGADIIMAFDECTEYPAERDARAGFDGDDAALAAARAEIISRRIKKRCRGLGHDSSAGRNVGPSTRRRIAVLRSRMAFKSSQPGQTQALFGIVQGGMSPRSAAGIGAADRRDRFAGLRHWRPQRGRAAPMTYEMVDAAIPYLPENKPRYLMGVGTPEEIVHYVAQGVDMMDCVLPTRAARHGLLFTSRGRLTIKNARYARDEGPMDPNCGCKVCAAIRAPICATFMRLTNCWRRR